MKQLVNLPKIVRTNYKGPKDNDGRPHGYGISEYFTKSDKKYKYEGHFVHGVRSGYGVWWKLVSYIREYTYQEWVQMGEYDSVGRLIHINTKPGPYREVINSWDKEFEGWWQNNNAVLDIRKEKYPDFDFAITEDEMFLNHFSNLQKVRKISDSMAAKLSNSNHPYGRYGYGVWLLATHRDEKSLQMAFEIFEESAREGIADALQMLSLMYDLGEAYDKTNKRFVLDRNLSKELNKQAIEKGSLRAKLKHNSDLFWGSDEIESDKDAAIAEALRESSLPDASILWSDRLGSYYEFVKEPDKAIKAYEKCIINGLYEPIFDLAMIYLNEGDDDYYKLLMNIGISLGVADCRILGVEQREQWEDLEEDEKKELHKKLKSNLYKGAAIGGGHCAYYLADFLLNGKMGFQIDLAKGKEYAEKALIFGFTDILRVLIEAAETLNDPEFVTERELLKLKLEALHYGLDNYLDFVIKNKDLYIKMGYGEEIESVWMPIWKEKYCTIEQKNN